MASDRLANYLKSQQVPVQWLSVLRAIAAELGANADSAQLHPLFVQVGVRFAQDAQDVLHGVNTLDGLNSALNEFWGGVQWGWVELLETPAGIEIAHHAAPLAQAFGDESLPWSSGLLQGFYQSIFASLDSSGSMEVSSMGQSEDGLEIHFLFGLKTH